MKQYTSIKNTNIYVDEGSKNTSIEDILIQRFQDPDILDKNLSDLHDPYLLDDMDKAVKRIKKAKQNSEKVMIFGDYDVDGVTSTSLLMHFFTKMGLTVSYRLPHRVEDGYGLKKKFIDESVELGVKLMVTVDCGSRDREIVSYAKELGLDIIVTDHHSVPEDTPDDAIAFINPNKKNSAYPYSGLCGAGVALKLIQALAKEYLDEKEYIEYIKTSIDVAALGTVADCMQLTGENRIIVKEGLRQIKNSRSTGLYSLVEDRLGEEFDSDIFGFHIGPRINAAGRMDTPYYGVNLILNNSESITDTLIKIESLNELRKLKTSEFSDQAMAEVDPDKKIIIFRSSKISHGIIGIVAGKLTEKFFKPSIVLIDEGDVLVASCRSPEYISIVDILEKFKDYFIAFGGHKQAAGFSIKKENYESFISKLETYLETLDFSSHKKELHVDKILSLKEIGFKLLDRMSPYKPFGMGNPKPVFMIENFLLQGLDFLGSGREHLRFHNSYGFKIFGFGLGEHYEEIKNATNCHLICELSEDHWQGQKNIMIQVRDVIL